MRKLFGVMALLLPIISFAHEKSYIQVSADGSVDVLPDYIQVNVIIEKTNKSRDAAKIATDIIAEQVIDVARKLHIEETHIQASEIFIQPDYEWEKGKRIHTGEKVHRSVNLKLYQLENYSKLAEHLTKLDITSMQQQGFGFDQIEEHQNLALMQALDKAKIKAQKIANNIKRKLGKVYQVTESGGQLPAIHPFQAERVMTLAEPSQHQGAPLEIKPQTVSASVNVVYLLD